MQHLDVGNSAAVLDDDSGHAPVQGPADAGAKLLLGVAPAEVRPDITEQVQQTVEFFSARSSGLGS